MTNSQSCPCPVVVEIDNREQHLIKHIADMGIDVIHVKVVSLDVGDIRISYNDTVILIIERKTLSDLYSSIRDGRYKDQKFRLLDNYDNNKVMYVIEGNLLNNTMDHTQKESIKSAIINTMVRDNIKVHNVQDVKQTAEFIKDIAIRLAKHPEKYTERNTNSGNLQTIAKHTKGAYVTPENVFVGMLCQVPGVSTTTASKIAEHYQSIKSFINNASEDELKNLKLNSGRKIGPKLANQIMTFIDGEKN